METGIQVIWWVGLIVALLVTLVILKEVAVVLRTLKDIHQLSEHVHKAALGIAANTAIEQPAVRQETADSLSEVTSALARLSASMQLKYQHR